MNLADFDLEILCTIASSYDGWSKQELIDKFGLEAASVINELLSLGLIKCHEYNLKPFMPPDSDYKDPILGNYIATNNGKLEVKRRSAKSLLTSKERWKERLIGAGITMLIWFIQQQFL